MVPLPQVKNFAALDLGAAATAGSLARVESLLASGVDPNAHFEDSSEATGDEKRSLFPPTFFFDENDAPALRRAAQDGNIRDAGEKPRLTRIMTALLQHGADPSALFRQPIQLHQETSSFPEEEPDEESLDEETDLGMTTTFRSHILRKALELDQLHQRQGTPVPQRGDPGYERDDRYEDALDYQQQYPRQYGTCRVLHSMLEAGMFVQPILDFAGDQLDVEQRDPQGRTLFLAACRSTIGLDSSVSGNANGLFYDARRNAITENPYPQPDSPWKPFNPVTTCSGPTLLEFFASRGANLLAVDHFGRNALHQLFTVSRVDDSKPPLNAAALRYLLPQCPSLVNQPDHAGFYPLHLAIRQIGSYDLDRTTFVPRAVDRLEAVVTGLLAAGADPLARDSHGNTVLHYLAASQLGKNNGTGEEQRRLLRVFLARGVDAKVRDTAGMSALDLFLTANNDVDDSPPPEEIRGEVIGLLE
ncbi:hypothetical protein FE257_006532 [Aspergillus nanangensis]|uniref:Uncharacterized protein n=1 Tax=Aspergillus nanangensis TaxID=2582783 RepID=A0AAD4GY87_ASPNN|nr:hypothetical protein FE257_006532 [Aspergillus nanangensis]